MIVFVIGNIFFIELGIGDVSFKTDNRLDPRFLTSLIKLNRAVHVGVIGKSQGSEPPLFGSANQLVNLRETVEQRVVRVDVEVNEVHRCRILDIGYQILVNCLAILPEPPHKIN